MEFEIALLIGFAIMNLAAACGTFYLMYQVQRDVAEIKTAIKSGFLTTIMDSVKGILGGLLGGFFGAKKV